MNSLSPRERYFAALAGEMPDQLPLTIWNNKLPGGDIDQQLLDLDVCVINKSNVWKEHYPGIDIETAEVPGADGFMRRHTIYRTPQGDLEMIERVMPNTLWIEKYLFSGPQDYPVLEYLISIRHYEAAFENFLADDRKFGTQSLAPPKSIHTPMNELIYEYMGVEKFSIEYGENLDKLLHLCSLLEEDCLNRVNMVASSPAEFAVIDGNTQISVIGLPRFKQYYMPYIEKACDILHGKKKYAGSHLDGNNRQLAAAIAGTSLDFIESFTPPPECDLSIDEARRLWPQKALLTHFPSSLHLFGINRMREQIMEILKHAAPGDRFTVGVSEDVPNRGLDTLVPLFTILRQNGQMPLKSG